MNDTTSGSDSREARTLDDPVMAFELDREIALLREEPGYASSAGRRRPWARAPHFRLVVTAARAGTEIGNEEAEDAMAIQVLDGGRDGGPRWRGHGIRPGVRHLVRRGRGLGSPRRARRGPAAEHRLAG